MRRKLAILNLVLLALIGLAGWRIRQTWLDARVRERQMFGRAFKPVPAPLLPAFPLAPPLTAGAYLDVAEKVLFSKDRNPVVVVEAAPEKPMPPLPVFHGVMDLGQGPTVILSEKAKSPHRGYRIGEQVGQFKLVAVDPSELEFEWDGKQVRRKFEELVDKTPPEAPAAQPAAAAAAPWRSRPSARR